MEKTHASIIGRANPLGKYQEVIVGSPSLLRLLYFEWCAWLTWVPGAVGLLLRKIFWPRLFASCGRGVMFGTGVVLRHPGRIHIGNDVIISDGCILDGRNSKRTDAITMADNVMLSNNVMLSCKNGSISIGEQVGINAQTIVQSTNDCPVRIGRDCIIGQGCLIIGGGSYDLTDVACLIREQNIRPDGGVILEQNVWLGGKVTVLGGVVIGSGSVLAAGSVATKSVPAASICMGIPAVVVKSRRSTAGCR